MMPKYIFRLLFLFSLLITASCAKRGNITGGDKDTIAPVLTASFPKNLSTNFTAKEIVLNFDEYVKMKNVNKQLCFNSCLVLRFIVIDTENITRKAAKARRSGVIPIASLRLGEKIYPKNG